MMRWVGIALLVLGAVGAAGHVLGVAAMAGVAASLTSAVIVTGAVFFATDLIVRKLSQLLIAAGVEDDRVGS